jgi:hypothetical protein
VRALLLFLGVFVALVVTVAAGWRHTPLSAWEALVARARPPASPDYYLGYSGSDFEHHIVYHGLEPVADPLRSADVIILGHSRTMYAFPRSFVERLQSRYHLRCYVLGFGQGEQDVFPMALIEKYDLRPRWVIVNADNFFSGTVSASARHAMRYGLLPALAVRFEGMASHAVRRVIHRVLPHFACAEAPAEQDWVTYRSISDGTWYVAAAKGKPTMLPPVDSSLEAIPAPASAAALRAAERMNRLVTSRGGKMVLTFVPSPLADLPQVRDIAARLGVPLVVPRMDSAMTLDGSHMTPESAEQFESAFLEEIGPYLAR